MTSEVCSSYNTVFHRNTCDLSEERLCYCEQEQESKKSPCFFLFITELGPFWLDSKFSPNFLNRALLLVSSRQRGWFHDAVPSCLEIFQCALF